MVQQPLRLENQRVGERQFFWHFDPVLIFALVQNERVSLGHRLGCQLVGLGLLEPERRSSAGRSRRQRGLLDSVSGCLLRPLSTWRNWDVVALAELSETSAGDPELLGQGVEWGRPGAVVELLVSEGRGEFVRISASS